MIAARLARLAEQRVASSRVRLGTALADAVPCLTTRERLSALIEDYAANVGAMARGEAWRKAMTSHERIVARTNGDAT